MPVWEIVVICLIPFYGWAGFFALSPLVDYIQRIAKAKACVRTEDFLKSPSFGLVTYLCGNIGAGKTTCGSAMCNMLSKIKMEQAKGNMVRIQGILNDIDFNVINAVIEMAFFQHHITNSNAIENFLCDYDRELDRKLNGKFYDNKLYPVSRYSLFRDYIDSYLAVIRNNYVYFARRGFYCWTTDTWAMDFTPDMIDINDRYIHHDYKIQRYTTIFDDEKILSGKKSTDYKKVADENGGGDKFFRLIRHFGKGTIHYISTSQDFGRVVKQERELATGIFYVMQRKEIHLNSVHEIFCMIGSDFLSRLQVFVYGLSEAVRASSLKTIGKKLDMCKKANIEPDKRLTDKYRKCMDSSSLKVNRLRDWQKHIKDLQNDFFADSYISYKGIYYTSADDVGKASKDCTSACFNVDFVFPLCFAYGSVDTYSFSIVSDYLVQSSKDCNDWYNPQDHKIPYESDDKFDSFMKGVLNKNGFVGSDFGSDGT